MANEKKGQLRVYVVVSQPNGDNVRSSGDSAVEYAALNRPWTPVQMTLVDLSCTQAIGLDILAQARAHNPQFQIGATWTGDVELG